MTDEDSPADAGTTDEQPPVLDWEATQAKIAKRQEERREVFADFGDGVAPFVLRGLDDDERTEAEQAAVSDNQQRRQRRGAEPDLSDMDTGAIKDTILKYGIVAGPDGFKPHREDHRKQLPPGVKDQLVDEIEDLSSLDVVEREQFQEMGQG